MANYDVEKLTKLGALKQLAERIKTDFATQTELEALESRVGEAEEDITELGGKIDAIGKLGGEPNVIVGIKVNGEDAEVGDDRVVDIEVPTDEDIKEVVISWANESTSDDTVNTIKEVYEYIASHKEEALELAGNISKLEGLVGDKAVAEQIADAIKNLATKEQVTSDIAKAVEGLAVAEEVTAEIEEAVAGLANAEQVATDIANAIKGLVKEETLNAYVEKTSLTETLLEYVKTTTLDGYVQKEGNKVLSTNDYTAADKAKVDALVYATENEIKEMLDEVFTEV